MATQDPIRNYLDGMYTGEDIDRVLGQLSDSDRFDAYSREVMAEADAVTDAGDRLRYQAEARKLLMDLEQSATGVVEPRYRHVRRVVSGTMVAVVVVLVIAAGFMMLFHQPQPEPVAMEYAELVTEAGEIKHLLLEDGTEVTLNACSRLRYPSNLKAGVDRHVLVDGQAFFKVARDEKRPFHVLAGSMDIKVLGTEFDVKSYSADEMASVKVKSGKVNVQLPEANMNLVADQQMLYSHASNDFSRRSGPVSADSWCHGELLFANASIADVARELERKFKCRIKLDPGSVFTNRLTGSHNGDDLASILQSLHYVANVGFRTERNGDIVLYSMK